MSDTIATPGPEVVSAAVGTFVAALGFDAKDVMSIIATGGVREVLIGLRNGVSITLPFTPVTKPEAPAESPLNLPIEQEDVANVETVGEYLAEILNTLLSEGEGFSGKRPLGNSDWDYNIENALEAHGYTGFSSLKDAVTAALTGKVVPE